ncbi:MAG: hypothetical protein M1819_001278 [Sarea resinae]|nr:MAG: hypothetical protein M1819_001278 [Sarea resinae]
MSAWIGTTQYADYFNSPDSNLQGGITASMSAGSLAGALGAGFLSDAIGRRKSLMIASCIWIVGSVIQLSSQNVAQLVAGRVINGLCVGITSSQVPAFLAELAPARIRGRVVGMQQWAIEWGILIMYLISYGCSKMSGPGSFRTAWGIQGIPALILFASMFFFPESPRWLAGKDRWEECLNTLAMLHGNGDTHHPTVQAEYLEVREAQRLAAEGEQLPVLGLFGKKMWRRTVAGVSVQMWQQLLGGNVMMYYIVYVFEMAGLTGNVNLTSSIIQYVIFVVTTGVTLLFIERCGRRPLFVYGGILMCGFNFCVAGLMASKGHKVTHVGNATNIKWELHGPYAKGVIACSYLFVACYGFTWVSLAFLLILLVLFHFSSSLFLSFSSSPIHPHYPIIQQWLTFGSISNPTQAPAAWIYCAEVFPLQYRAKGVGLSAATNWAFNFALAFFVPPAFENIQWRTYIIFGVFCAAATVHSFVGFPETAGRTLEEIDEVFDSKLPAWRSSGVKSHFSDRVAAIERKGEMLGEGVVEQVEIGGQGETVGEKDVGTEHREDGVSRGEKIV